MPAFQPFRGERYAPGVLLDLVVAPPYDVIDDTERAVLAARHPANAVAVELPADPGPGGGDRYAAAARCLEQWRRQGVLQRDPRPALYRYRMTTPSGGRTTGVIGALGCGPGVEGVLPHEQTTPKDMTDRLSLLRACRANLSPVWGLSLAAGLAEQCRPDGPPAGVATAEGVRHELWVVDDPDSLAALCRTVAGAPVVLADGHHRFQTAAAYAAERGGDEGAAWIMAFVVELSPTELEVGPIDRTVVSPGGPDALVEAVGRRFALEAAAADGGLQLVTRTGRWRLEPSPATLAAVGGDGVDSALVAPALADLPGATVRFDHDRDRVVAAVRDGTVDGALLLRPVPVDTIGRWAAEGRRMPPKSTYFWPKPRTGMVFRPLDG